MKEIFLFLTHQGVIFGSKRCQSYRIHSLSWQKTITLPTLGMRWTICQNIMYQKRTVSFIMQFISISIQHEHIKVLEYPLIINYREHTLYRGTVIWERLNKSGQQKEEPLGIDPRNHFPSTIHLWEMDTLATRSGLSLRETLLHILRLRMVKNINFLETAKNYF